MPLFNSNGPVKFKVSHLKNLKFFNFPAPNVSCVFFVTYPIGPLSDNDSILKLNRVFAIFVRQEKKKIAHNRSVFKIIWSFFFLQTSPFFIVENILGKNLYFFPRAQNLVPTKILLKYFGSSHYSIY